MNDVRLLFDEQAHVYTLDGRVLPSVTEILKATGVADFSGPWFTDDIKQRGTYVHAAIQLDNAGELDVQSLDPQLVPYLTGWRKFLADTAAVIEHWERRICDPVLGYAGMLDGIIRRRVGTRDRREVLDVKCGLYPSVGPQTAAYRRCAYALYNWPVVLHRSAVELPGDGTYRYQPLDSPDDEPIFLAALRIFNWRSSHDARR